MELAYFDYEGLSRDLWDYTEVHVLEIGAAKSDHLNISYASQSENMGVRVLGDVPRDVELLVSASCK